jgi:diguanylate cyclase (GGDEF)-like protein/PAS domain S-box-containing protein
VFLTQARRAYVPAAIFLVLSYYVCPPLRPVTAGAIGGFSAAAIWLGVTRARPDRWGAWLCIAASVVLLGIGDVMFATTAGDEPSHVEFPGPTDLFYVAAYAPLAIGLLWLGHPRVRSRDWQMLLDTAALSLSASLLVWIVLASPGLSQNPTGAAKIIAVLSWCGYVAVLAASARVMVAWRTSPALALLACGALAYLIADFFYARLMVSGAWSTGSLIDLGYFAFSLLAGAAGLAASVGKVDQPRYARHELGLVRLGMLAIAVLVGPTLLLVQATVGAVTNGVAIAAVSAAVGALILGRIWLSSRAYQSRADREQAVRLASRALVLATTYDEAVAAVRNAFHQMITTPGTATVHLDEHADSRDDSEIAELSPDGAEGTLRVPVGPDDAAARTAPDSSTHAGRVSGSLVFTGPMADLLELAPVLHGLADQAGSAMYRINLLADRRAEERERYFRTLVVTSEDVILISQDGYISYATPSAWEMFGGDVVGRHFDDLVHAHRRATAPTALAISAAASQTEHSEMPFEATVRRPDGTNLTVRVRRRDLTTDPTVAGVVTTLHDVTAERQLQRELAHRATHDPLTGLANSELFATELRAEDSLSAGRDGESNGRAALFVDLDDFKTVNDTYGHDVGDRLLIEVAQRIQSCLRPADVAARLGGDEFAVLLRDIGGVHAARGVAERIADTLARPTVIDDVTVECLASIGLAYASDHGHMDTLLREADTALYAAKAQGKGGWRQYTEGMGSGARST